jgi:hypothetical protein
MSEPTPKPANRLLTAFRRVTPAQAAIVISLLAGGIYTLQVLPEERLPWARDLIMGIVTLGTLGTLATGSATGSRSAETPADPPPPPAPVRRNRKDGSCDVVDMAMWSLYGVGLALVSWVSR